GHAEQGPVLPRPQVAPSRYSLRWISRERNVGLSDENLHSFPLKCLRRRGAAGPAAGSAAAWAAYLSQPARNPPEPPERAELAGPARSGSTRSAGGGGC